MPAKQLSSKREKRLRLGTRALEILAALVERPGVLITKADSWLAFRPIPCVEEGNLRVHMAAAIVAQMPARRFITIAGPGGIGKTTVALAVADQLSGAYRDGVWLVDLAPVADPRLAMSALASVLGVAIHSENPLPALISFLHNKEMLLLFDNCEHVVEVAAGMVEEIYRRAPNIHILATSREPLRAEGERVQRLLPLAVPNTIANITAKEALSFPAIQLFVERAAANSNAFTFVDADAPIVADICRRLDGIALAIELAAGSVDTFGINGLAVELDDRFRLLRRGRRTALPRHQTLGAMLDWSYEFLPKSERVVLRRLAVFGGRFILASAQAIVATDIDAEASPICCKSCCKVARRCGCRGSGR